MRADPLAFATIAGIRGALARGETSAEELARHQLERARRAKPLGAFISLYDDEFLQEARAADEARRRGEALGPLHGVPITLKDLVHVGGRRTTSGSKICADFVPERSAPVVERLRDAGAIVLGKTNLHELAYGVTNVNPHYGAARNPWNPERISGGSSGGSAVALAAGIGFGSIGTDTGGSIRIPSSLCGTVGLKPTYGTVPREGVTPLSWSLDHVGPMGRTVEDVTRLYEVVAGLRPRAIELGALPEGLRLGVHEKYFFEKVSPETEAAVRRAIGRLSELGMRVVGLDIPEIEIQATCRNTIAFAEASSFHEESIRNRPEEFGEDTRELLRLGLLIPATAYLTAAKARRTIVGAFRRAFQDIDVLATPATAAPAPRLDAARLETGEELRSGLLRLSGPFNTTGFPALSLPCGFTADGRPVGLQLAARPREEALLLRVAHAYEQSEAWWKRHPDAVV